MTPDKLGLFLYSISRWCYLNKLEFLAKVFKLFMVYLCSMEVDYRADIKKGFTVHHGFGLIIGGSVKAGMNLHVNQGVTVGGSWGKEKNGQRQPVIGDNVWIMAGAKVIGPIMIGSNVIVGANSVVNNDVPDNSVVAGSPSKLIRRITEKDIQIIKEASSLS